ncbi:MAG: U32 family peptidase [Bacilli bacterium]|nr:U32 family peptidase [Bacilli bacterium]
MKYELLMPAGDLERLKIACLYGADAVYIGGYDYSLRANANNFLIEEMKEAVEFAHNLGKKVYVTVNMIFHSKDLKNLDEYLKTLETLNVDSVIVSDLAVIESIKRQKLNLKFFISTQKSITNVEAVKFYESLGAYRVVLARECSREDIIEIKKNTNVEIEVFIHGAMCTSYSGRCVLSNYVTKRDSNRGGCSQVCRFAFENNYDKDLFISSKDLNMIDYIPDMMDLNIESFKVEGRMKSLYYIATIASCYRNVIDKKLNNTLSKEDISYYKKILERCSNRENAPQFYNKPPGVEEQYYTGRVEISNQDFLAIVLDYNESTKEVTLEQRNKFEIGDKVEFFGPNHEVKKYTINEMKNAKNEDVKKAPHPGEIIKIKVPFKLDKYDMMRVEIS